jgi:hypothetical protein
MKYKTMELGLSGRLLAYQKSGLPYAMEAGLFLMHTIIKKSK